MEDGASDDVRVRILDPEDAQDEIEEGEEPSAGAAIEEIRLSYQENKKIKEFLDSASRSTDRFDLKEGFYTEPVPTRSWHQLLSDDDANSHHRAGVFPHTWHPLNQERRRSSSKLSPRVQSDMYARSPSLLNLESSKEHDSTSHPVQPSKSEQVIESSYGSSSDDGLASQMSSENTMLSNTQSPDPSDAVFTSREISELDGLLNDERKTPGSCVSVRASIVERPSVSERPSLPIIFEGMSFTPTTERQHSSGKVAFILGADDIEILEPSSPDTTEKSTSPLRSHRTNRKSSQNRPRNDISHRRVLGSEVSIQDSYKLPISELIDETVLLENVHQDDIASHRFDHSKGIRHRKHRNTLTSVVHIDKGKLIPTKTPSRQPSRLDPGHHKMFVELDELRLGDNQEWAWQEKARWIKFEEDVEEDAQRWGKPHVSSLSFHSLLELRRCIEFGAVILDLDADDLPSIASRIVDSLVSTDQLKEYQKTFVLQVLLLKHRHLTEQQAFLRRNHHHTNLIGFAQSHNANAYYKHQTPASVDCVLSSKISPEFTSLEETKDLHKNAFSLKEFNHTNLLSPKETPSGASLRANLSAKSLTSGASSKNLDPNHTQFDPHILKRIPEGAEATNVLVGSAEFLDKPITAFVRLQNAALLGNLTEVPLPVRFIFLLMGPVNCSLDYHEIGRSLSTLMADQRFHDAAYKADDRHDLLNSMNEFLNDSIVLPPGEWDEKTLLPILDIARQNVLKKRSLKEKTVPGAPEERDPLKRTGRPFGGLIDDAKKRYPFYLSDIKDGLNLQCFAAFFFVYFACLSPAITFGGLLGDKTNKWMGVNEMLVSTAICGTVFALFSGQPLIIVGATGPVVVFEEALFKICDSMGIDFLTFRSWVGAWVTVICMVVVLLEGSFLVRYITRFTEEIFALLISLIFIYEVFKKLYIIFVKNPLQEFYPPPAACQVVNLTGSTFDPWNDTTVSSWNGSNVEPFMWLSGSNSSDNSTRESCVDDGKYPHPNTALLSVILTFGTFLIAYFLKHFRNSKFLGRNARRAIGDFGVPIAIILMALVDFLIKETHVEKLDVPDGLMPTAPHKRTWIVNPFGQKSSIPVWSVFAAIVPAILIFILLFMEAQITSMIVNKKDRKLLKGSGYHLDLFLIGILATVCGLMGLPFMCSATVRSVTHVSALCVFSRTHAPGEKPQLLEVKEQRLTSLAVHLMVGVSVMMGPILRQIPLPVLFGIFLYMGIASITGIQLVQRVKLMFMPVKHHPNVGYARRVRLLKMNMYTSFQLICLGILWAVKSTQAAVAFPFVLILMVPVRLYLFRFLFTPQELKELDQDEECVAEDEEMEPDFYTQAHMPI